MMESPRPYYNTDHGSCESAGEVGLKLAEAERIVAWLQETVVKEQLAQYCEAARTCSVCGHRRLLKDNRQRRFYTVFGKITVKAPRFHGCRALGHVNPGLNLIPHHCAHIADRIASLTRECYKLCVMQLWA
jgi:hypothetical protein